MSNTSRPIPFQGSFNGRNFPRTVATNVTGNAVPSSQQQVQGSFPQSDTQLEDMLSSMQSSSSVQNSGLGQMNAFGSNLGGDFTMGADFGSNFNLATSINDGMMNFVDNNAIIAPSNQHQPAVAAKVPGQQNGTLLITPSPSPPRRPYAPYQSVGVYPRASTILGGRNYVNPYVNPYVNGYIAPTDPSGGFLGGFANTNVGLEGSDPSLGPGPYPSHQLAAPVAQTAPLSVPSFGFDMTTPAMPFNFNPATFIMPPTTSRQGRLQAVQPDPRPYKCDAVNCIRDFKRKADLRRHQKSHMRVLPYACRCSRRFARTDALQVCHIAPLTR